LNAPERTPNTASDGQEVAASGPELVELVHTVLQHETAFTFGVTGASMWPFLRDGDLVTVSPVRGKVHIGDVVAVVHPDAEVLLLHRVVGRTGDSYLIKGDATAQPDGLASTERILGRVTHIQRTGQEVRFGLGREGRWIAACSRRRLLLLILLAVWRPVDSMSSWIGRARHSSG